MSGFEKGVGGLFLALSHIVLPQSIAEDTNSNGTCATFIISNEDHTIGNLLRYMLMKELAGSNHRDHGLRLANRLSDFFLF